MLEMIWSRPTCEVNGMGGGYQGAGFKTVIPAQAMAKVSFRLVFDQDPHKVRAAFRESSRRGSRPTAGVEFHGARRRHRRRLRHRGAGVPEDAGRAQRRVGQRGGLHRRRRLDPGGDADQGQVRIEVVMVGFGLADDRIHSPNEKYDLKSFHKGIRSWGADSQGGL